MKNTLSHLLAASAAIGLAIAPIAAQANTRAGDSTPIYAMQGLPFVDVDDDDDDDEGGWLRGILFGGLLIGALGGVLIVVGDGDNQSPPNNQSPGAS